MNDSERVTAIQLSIGLDAIASYKRLNYTAWHALAEFVDNSTQAYFDNREELDAAFAEDRRELEVSIVYDRDEGIIRIADNSTGMSVTELDRAMHIAQPPADPHGRCRYGMGLKTSACWLGNMWTVRTKRLGESSEHSVTVDVNRILSGNADLQYAESSGKDESQHYTVIEITDLNQTFHGRRLGKIKQFLRSMYRVDLTEESLTLKFNDEVLRWEDLNDQLLTAHDGALYKKEFEFSVNGRKANGWVGILDRGSRSKAGFSILHSRRVVRGWPDAWRPTTLYGQFQGSNDLVNQRLIGEINLDEFDVSHTKDDISWVGDELEQVEDELLKFCTDYKEIAQTRRKDTDDERGPSKTEIDVAIDEFQRELESPQLQDKMRIDEVPPPEVSEQAFKPILDSAVHRNQAFGAQLDGVIIKGFVATDLSNNDPYVTIDAARENEVIVIINMQHPHITYIDDEVGLINYFRHCTYDAVAEWKALRKTAQISPKTIRLLKDSLLRISFELDMNREQPSDENDD